MIDNLLSNIRVLNDVIASDHKPVSFRLCGIMISSNQSAALYSDTICKVPMWNRCDSAILSTYASRVDERLSCIDIPLNALTDISRDKSIT